MTAPGVAVEVATWRPLEQVEVDGWTVGLSDGFTRRANSVVPVRSPRDVAAAMTQVEALYAGRGIPAVFRVCAAGLPADLDERLEDRGYAALAHTAVMVASLPLAAMAGGLLEVAGADRSSPSVVIGSTPDRAWLRGWLEVKAPAAGAVALDRAARILLGSDAAYLSTSDADGVTGVVRAAFEQGWAGLSCLTVAPRVRRRGIGRLLTLAALGVASRRGATQAFLQVEESNGPATRLYEELGFVVADRYHYRQR